jgi:hypothetical protein
MEERRSDRYVRTVAMIPHRQAAERHSDNQMGLLPCPPEQCKQHTRLPCIVRASLLRRPIRWCQNPPQNAFLATTTVDPK